MKPLGEPAPWDWKWGLFCVLCGLIGMILSWSSWAEKERQIYDLKQAHEALQWKRHCIVLTDADDHTAQACFRVRGGIDDLQVGDDVEMTAGEWTWFNWIYRGNEAGSVSFDTHPLED